MIATFVSAISLWVSLSAQSDLSDMSEKNDARTNSVQFLYERDVLVNNINEAYLSAIKNPELNETWSQGQDYFNNDTAISLTYGWLTSNLDLLHKDESYRLSQNQFLRYNWCRVARSHILILRVAFAGHGQVEGGIERVRRYCLNKDELRQIGDICGTIAVPAVAEAFQQHAADCTK